MNYLSDSLQRSRRLLVLLIATAFVLGGCAFKINIQQGNFLEQDQMDQVQPGMTREQVRFLLGTPMIEDPFHADRWDYVYYITVGSRQRRTNQRRFTVFFDGDQVLRTEQPNKPEPEPEAESTSETDA